MRLPYTFISRLPPVKQTKFMAVFCCLFVWCCRVCQTKIDSLVFSRLVEFFFGVLRKKYMFLLWIVSADNPTMQTVPSMQGTSSRHELWFVNEYVRNISSEEGIFITYGKWGCFYAKTHKTYWYSWICMIGSSLMNTQKGSPCSSLKKIEGRNLAHLPNW